MSVINLDSKDSVMCKKCVLLNIVNCDTLADWNEWIYSNESYEKYGKMTKENECSNAVLANKFQDEMDIFKMHVYNVHKQYEAYKCCN